MHAHSLGPSIDRVREQVMNLRDDFGPQDWLSVVSGVTGAAYRHAGMTAEEFATLLRDQTIERGSLSIHLRRKPIMRLRKGFEGHSGSLMDRDGFVVLNLHFGGGRYSDEDNFGNSDGETIVATSKPLPTFMRVTGDMHRNVSELPLTDIPRCVLDGSGQVRSSSLECREWAPFTTFHLGVRYETLGIMPDAVADALGIERQRHLGHIPWLGIENPLSMARLPTSTPVARTSARGRVRPQLRLVV